MNFTIKKRYLFGAIFAIIIISCVISINIVFPKPAMRTANAGETLSFEGLEYRLTDWYLMTQDEYVLKKDKIHPEGFYNLDDDIWCFIYVEFEVSNPSKEAVVLPVAAGFNCNKYGNHSEMLAEDGRRITNIGAEETRTIHCIFILHNGLLEDMDADSARIIFSRTTMQYEMKLQ